MLLQDADLKRCFGVDKNIKDCDWVFLETLRTSQTPYEPLARLVDLLKLFSRSEWQGIWLLLDIKVSLSTKGPLDIYLTRVRSTTSLKK